MAEPTARPVRFPAEYGEPSGELRPWSEIESLIVAAKNYFLATTKNGAPYVRPVDGVFIDGVLAFGGSPETQWIKNLIENPRVSISLPDDEHAVIIEGTAELIEDPGLSLVAALDAANRVKYPQYFTDDTPQEFHPFWIARPQRVLAWSLTDFPARATRFDFG